MNTINRYQLQRYYHTRRLSTGALGIRQIGWMVLDTENGDEMIDAFRSASDAIKCVKALNEKNPQNLSNKKQ